MSGNKEELIPLKDNEIKMYVCGLTVYDFMHIGNARTLVVFDAVVRYLRYKGYKVLYVRNFTDIDDRIIKKANAENVDFSVIANRYINEATVDSAALNLLTPDIVPLATAEMPEIIFVIQTLIEKGFAYEKNGSVFYDAVVFKDYGKLSGKNTEELIVGARVELNDDKRNPIDFVLWKPSKTGEPGWESPWGLGRPGWHIECSAMVKKYLGSTIDIHAGGEDLIFPHHENEIAQSEAANDCTFSRYWLHTRHLCINNKKMSKSEGNFFTIREITEKYPAEVIRFFLLAGHYRSTLNYSEELIIAADNSYNRIKNCVINLNEHSENNKTGLTETEKASLNQAAEFKTNFIKAMDDDFNTADAITAVFELVKFANITYKESSGEYAAACANLIIELCDILGILIKTEQTNDDEINGLIEQRQAARKAKDFKKADEIRDVLLSMGIELEDTRQGVRWSRKR